MQTAIDCANLGVDYIGLNFSPMSKRKITKEVARDIMQELENFPQKTQIVFLFYHNDGQSIHNILQYLPSPQYIQFVTEDSLEVLTILQQYSSSLIPQFPIRDDFQSEDLHRYNTEFMILDTYQKGQGGGSGKTFDWQKIAAVERKYFLAGGLNPDNVQQAIRLLNPYAVDVASGVEKQPGQKDKNLIEEFVRNVQEV